MKFAFFLLIVIARLNCSYGQSETLIVENVSINLKKHLGINNFTNDTIKELDGYIYFFDFANDSGYIRVNALTNSEFDCCDGVKFSDKKELEIGVIYSSCIKLDQGGTIIDTKLSWRRMIIGEFEIIYNGIPESILSNLNNAFSSIKLELSEACESNGTD